jgi:formylglycine-generating enzyme required for sulfatase activity
MEINLPRLLASALVWSILCSTLLSCRSRQAGAVRTNRRDEQRYVWIEKGTFDMGCSANDSQCDSIEKPARTVVVAKPFWIGQTEVTTEAFRRFVKAG